MAVAIPDLWPDAVTMKDVVSPLMILRHQAGLLRARSQNVLEAEISSIRGKIDEDSDTIYAHLFRIIVPALGRKTYELFEVRHSIDLVYPATVIFAPLANQYGPPVAASQTEFTSILAKVFNHPRTISVIQSLLVQANEDTSEALPND